LFPSYLLSLREGLEAALIIGILLGALRKLNRTDHNRIVWIGAGSAGLLSLATAIVLQSFSMTLEGKGEKIFEGITMLLAASVLTWMIFWMRQHTRTLKHNLETDVRQATGKNGSWTLLLVAFLAVLREGVELALILTATLFTSGAQQTLTGAVFGLLTAVFLGWGLFASTIKLNLKRFFQVTSVLLILFAAGLVAHGIHEFIEAGIIPAIIEQVWDINHILEETSYIGQLLKTLFGYNGNPSLTEVLAYSAYLVGILFVLRPTPPHLLQKTV